MIKKYNVTVNGVLYEVMVEETTGDINTPEPKAQAEPVKAPPVARQEAPAAEPQQPTPAADEKSAAQSSPGGYKINAPMPGAIIKINVEVGMSIKKDDVLCILEAMKMENEIFAPRDGVVASVKITQGTTVNTGDLLFTLN
jgi:biotin carboxyl carrier protein